MGAWEVPTELAQCDRSLPALGTAWYKWWGWGPIEACLCQSFGRSRCCRKNRRSYGRWLPQARTMSVTWRMARYLDEWSRDLLIWQGWWVSRMHYLDLDMVFKQTCQSGQSFLYLSDVVPEFFLDFLYGTDSSFPLVSHISKPLKMNSALSISLDVLLCIWCMHAWHEKYKMTCYVQKCLTDHDLMHTQ